MTELVSSIAGPIDIILDWDGRTLDSLKVDSWTPELARGSFDVGSMTFRAVAYSVPRLQPDGRITARIYVQPDAPAKPHRAVRPRPRRRLATRSAAPAA